MNILLVDDRQSNIKVLRYALVGMDNLDIYEAPNGEVAVELATKHEFDIILMDVNMPIMGGLEATKIIKGLNKHAIIVGISSDSELSTIHAMIKAGADDYLVKPIVAQIFRHRIKYYINAAYNDRLINYDGKPINAFNTQCQPCYCVFKIKEEANLNYFVEYMMQTHILTCSGGEDCYVHKAVNAIFAICAKLAKLTKNFLILVEKSDFHYYFTITNSSSINISFINEYLSKLHDQTDENIMFKIKKEYFSVEAPLNISHAKQKLDIHENVQSFIEHNHSTHNQEPTVFDFMDKDDLIELSDYMTDLDSSLSVLLLSKLSSQEIAFISNTLQKISALLSSYNETYDISAAIKSLGIVVGENIEECADKSQKLAKLFLGFMEDLQNWRDALFVNGASSVDFLDATIISDALMIANTIKPPKAQASDDDEDEDIFAF